MKDITYSIQLNYTYTPNDSDFVVKAVTLRVLDTIDSRNFYLAAENSSNLSRLTSPREILYQVLIEI